MRPGLWDPRGCHHQQWLWGCPIPTHSPPSWLLERVSPGCREFGDFSFFDDFPALGNHPLAPAPELPPAARPWCRAVPCPGLPWHGTAQGAASRWVLLCSGHPRAFGGFLAGAPPRSTHSPAAGHSQAHGAAGGVWTWGTLCHGAVGEGGAPSLPKHPHDTPVHPRGQNHLSQHYILRPILTPII